ncbi:osiris 5 [Musca autumnalis]|uniref:osiris 5 n=1 Tax=Musca autumnalis TaxID=221902 RepID=UPI003CF57173
MLKNFIFLYLKIQFMILLCQASLPEEDIENNNHSNIDDCTNNSLESMVWCRGSKALQNALNNLSKTNKPVVIVRGLELVHSKNQHLTNYTSDGSDSNQVNANFADNTVDNGDSDDTFLGRFSRYLKTHELNIKFSDLLADVSERHYMARDLDQSGMQINSMSEEARKKDKGGGAMMLMAVMFSKMMAVMGLGGLGALAMKALGVSMMALMMAALVGVKSLASQGHESTHSVQYVTADGHHHRRRRRRNVGIVANNNYAIGSEDVMLHENVKSTLPLVYRGWTQKLTR